MTGWVCLGALMLAVAASFVVLGVPRRLWSLVGAAMMLGATGYALQGRPGMAGHRADPAAGMPAVDQELIDLRTQMFGRFGSDGAYLVAADALARNGSPTYEVQAILGGIRHSPDSAMLWTALGDAIARHDGGRLSTPARFAFDRAERLDPRHPGPPFFLGLAQVREEDFAGAAASWHRALAATARDAPYRASIARRVVLLDRLRAVMAGQGIPGNPIRP